MYTVPVVSFISLNDIFNNFNKKITIFTSYYQGKRQFQTNDNIKG